MKGDTIMIECKLYNLTELKAVLKIPKRHWEERRQELLEYLKLFFDYEITLKGRGYCFNIKEQYMEYEQMPRKQQIKEIKDFYAKEVDDILKHKPRNTGANLAREIIAKNNQQNHKEGTASNYIRPYLKANYTVSDKDWCRINYNTFSYELLPSEELQYLKELFNTYLNSEATASAIADHEAGYATKEEAYDRLRGRYNEALFAFKEKYGYRPYKAGELKKKAWVVQE